MVLSFKMITLGAVVDRCIIANRHRRLAAQHKTGAVICGAKVFCVSHAKT
jgi:hypothetical protein